MKAPRPVARRSSWLTLRRIRLHVTLLAVCLWSIYALDLATPGMRDRAGQIKGADFLHFYTLGTLARQERGQALYDMAAQAEAARQLFPQAAGNFYVAMYGPQVSLLFAPLAHLPYGWAAAVWALINSLIYALCCYAVWRVCPSLKIHGTTVVIAAAAYPGFFNLISWGQTSGLALGCFTVAYFAWRARRPWLAGLALGSLAFKPQLGLLAAFVFLVARQWKVVAGAILAAAAQFALAWTHYGTLVMRTYWQALRRAPEVMPWLEPRPYHMHSLRAFWSLLLPWQGAALVLFAASATAIAAAMTAMWRSRAPLQLRFSALLLGSVLVAPHLTVYDLVVLAPAFLLLADWTLANAEDRFSPAVRVLLYLGYALPLLGPSTRFTHLQISVLAFLALFLVLARWSQERSNGEPALLV